MVTNSSERRSKWGVRAVLAVVMVASMACHGMEGGGFKASGGENKSDDWLMDFEAQEPVVDTPSGGDDTPVVLVSDGVANFPVVVGPEADEKTREAADTLAHYLEFISGVSIEVVQGDAHEGLVVGVPSDFESLPIDGVRFGDGPMEREDYRLRTEADRGLYILGASPVAVHFAVWDFLYRLGHRQFFPTETWEVIPERERIEVALDVQESPDYHNRQAPRVPMRIDRRPWAQEAWHHWQRRNRTLPTFELATGHAYDAVISANQQAFDDHPEYWGWVDGEHSDDAQPNVAHQAVQQMFIDHALDRLAQNPHRDTVAMDPLDGPRWSEDEASQHIGGPSEQAVYLANLVADAVVNAHGDDTYVGIYGYSHHSPPPSIDVHPNVIVSLATAFIRKGYTFDEMLQGWSERADNIGIREYYSLWEWDYSLPFGGGRASRRAYLAETIPHFHEQGARFINAESSDAWGLYGLGYYLASRMLWDVEEAQRLDVLVEDFLVRAFGPARDAMEAFYELIDGDAPDPLNPQGRRSLNEDTVAMMYRHLDQARADAGDDEAIVERIDDLILYTRYVELFRAYRQSDAGERQQAFDELVSYAWRIRGTMMTENIELLRNINHDVRTDDALQWGDGYTGNQPSDHHRVDEDKSFSQQEVIAILEEGLSANHPLELDVDPWHDGGIVEPSVLPSAPRGGTGDMPNRGAIEALLYTDDGQLPEIVMSAGHIYDDRGPLQWDLYDQGGHSVDSGEVAPDHSEYVVDLQAEPGVYRLSITNTGQGFIWDYEPRGAKMTFLAGGEYGLERNYFDRLYFYVPQGVDEVILAGTLTEGRHTFYDGSQQPISANAIEEHQGYTIIPVPEGQDGTAWSLETSAIRIELAFVNTPGYVALSPQELLLPVELEDEW